MPTPSSRIAFSIGSLDIMWYGIFVALAIALSVFLPMIRGPKHGLSQDRVLNYAMITVISGIIGARLYYIVFNWQYYGEDLSRIFALREGGLAIHGGLLFGTLAAFIAARRYKNSVLNLCDLAFTSIPLGQAIGRWGNYFNQEAHGGPTDLPWAITVDGMKVHPTFLYESIWCFLLFLFLLIVIEPRRKFNGQTFLLYCILYSIERFFVEALRTDSLMLGSLKQAQVLSLIVIAVAVVAYVYLSRHGSAPGEAFPDPGLSTGSDKPAEEIVEVDIEGSEGEVSAGGEGEISAEDKAEDNAGNSTEGEKSGGDEL